MGSMARLPLRTGLKAHQCNSHTIWQPLISAMSINPLYWLSPVKFGIKSTCDGNYRRSCRSRRVLVIPPLTFDRYVQVSLSDRNSSHESTVCACVRACDCVCARVCVVGLRIRDNGSICSAPSVCLSRRRLLPVKRCINTEMTRRTLLPQPQGRPSHLPLLCSPASGRCCSGYNALEEGNGEKNGGLTFSTVIKNRLTFCEM